MLPTVKSQTVFKFLIEFYINNTSKNEIDLTDLVKAFMSKNSEDGQEKILQTIYLLAIDNDISFAQKNQLVDNVLPHIFKASSYSAFETFFQENIKQIMEQLKNVSDYGNGLVNFLLIELLFLRIPIGSEERIHCSITEASGNPKLRALLLKSALDAFRNNNTNSVGT